jgi:hypothetical protein
MRLTALFHDIGKPISYKEDEEGVGHFYGHWDESNRIFSSFAKKNGVDMLLQSFISDLIFYHDIDVTNMDVDGLKEMFSKLKIEGMRELYEFKRADMLAQNPKFSYMIDYYNQQEEIILPILIDKAKEDYYSIKTPDELMKFMDRNILYGWVDNNGNRYVNELTGLREKYRTSSIDETLEIGVGTCIEQANMIKLFFDRIGKETKVICHRAYETEENFDKEVRMHCFVLYKDGDSWYHFEHSNLGRKGIHKYNSVEEAIDDITRYHREHGDIRKITEIPDLPAGLSFKEFNNYVNSFDRDEKTK